MGSPERAGDGILLMPRIERMTQIHETALDLSHPSFLSRLRILRGFSSRTEARNLLLAVGSPTANSTGNLATISFMESGFQCAGCGEWNVTNVDESAGRRQRYVEDCQVCCKPNLLQLEYDPEEQQFWISAQLE